MVSVACWALLLTSYSASINAQTPDPTTGNLINFSGTPTATTGNWVNGVYVNGLTCWRPGDPGNCGPYPNVQTNGSINFSYGQVNLYQVVNINQALAAAGNNLQVTGFNFGFRAKNGNGWDDGRQDYLSAYVKFLNSTGGIAANYDYTQYTNRQYNWTNFNFSETFANPSLAASYRAAQVGFVGRDNNGWAGPYGPEIANVSFNLKYRVDPCATDPTSSPACPGFAAAMNAKTPAPTAPVATPTVDVIAVVPTVTSSISSTTAKPVTDMAKPNTQSRSVATALSTIAKNQQREQAIQNSAVQTATSDAAAAGDRAQQQSVAVAASLTTLSQTLSNASVQTQRQSGAATVNTISTSQTQTGPPVANTASAGNENKSVAATTPAQAPAPRATALSVASVSFATHNDTQTSTTPNIQSYFSRTQTATPVQATVTTSSLPPQPNKSANTAAVVTVAPVIVNTTNTPVFSQATTEQQSNVSFAYVQSQNSMFLAMAAAPVEQQQQTTVQPVSIARQAEIEQVNNSTSFMTNRTDPLNEVVEAKPAATTTTTTESNQTVKANVAENELAGGVDFGKLATTPAGYGSYTSLMLQDGKLYEPKEIYKNQKPVDNARALRQLSTDRLHQQMIEQQYRR